MNLGCVYPHPIRGAYKAMCTALFACREVTQLKLVGCCASTVDDAHLARLDFAVEAHVGLIQNE